jgi:hypothetical protein
VYLAHCAKGQIGLAPSDEPTVHFVDAAEELQGRSSEVSSVEWTEGPLEGTVGLFDDQVWTRQRCPKTRAVASDEPMVEQRFIRRSWRSYSKVFVTTPSEIIPYYRLNHSIWSNNKESSHWVLLGLHPVNHLTTQRGSNICIKTPTKESPELPYKLISNRRRVHYYKHSSLTWK